MRAFIATSACSTDGNRQDFGEKLEFWANASGFHIVFGASPPTLHDSPLALDLPDL
jgi:hypothetical protein